LSRREDEADAETEEKGVADIENKKPQQKLIH